MTGRRDEFQALASFVRGYLHEDLPTVHGSVRAAAAAFCADASPDERRQLADEVAALMAIKGGSSVRNLRRFVSKDLGLSWRPKSREELAELVELMRSQK